MKKIILYCAVIILSFFSSFVLCFSWPLSIAFFFGCLYLVGILYKPYFLPFFILISSTCAGIILQKVNIGIGGNLNGMLNFLFVMTGVGLFLLKKVYVRGLSLSVVFFLFFLFCCVSLIDSYDLLVSLKGCVRVLSGFFIYVFICNFIKTREKYKSFVLFLFCVLSFSIVIGCVQIVFINNFVLDDTLRVSGPFKNGQSFSLYLAIALPVILGIKDYFLRNKVIHFLGVFSFLLGVIVLLYTNTRMGWGASFLAILIYCIWNKQYKWIGFFLSVIFFIIITKADVVLDRFGAFMATPLNMYFSSDVSSINKSSCYDSVSSLHIRFYVWKEMFQDFLKHYLIGCGLSTWYGVRSVEYSVSLASHSDYMEILYGTGVLGFISYMCFKFRQIFFLLTIIKHKGINYRGVARNLRIAVFAIYIAYMFVGLTEVWTAYVGVSWMMWIVYAVAELDVKLEKGSYK